MGFVRGLFFASEKACSDDRNGQSPHRKKVLAGIQLAGEDGAEELCFIGIKEIGVSSLVLAFCLNC